MNESRAHASVQRRRVPRLRSMVCIAIAGMLSLLSSQSHAVTATYRYDGLGRLVKVSYASGEFIEYVYDAAGNVVEEVKKKWLEVKETGKQGSGLFRWKRHDGAWRNMQVEIICLKNEEDQIIMWIGTATDTTA